METASKTLYARVHYIIPALTSCSLFREAVCHVYTNKINRGKADRNSEVTGCEVKN